MNLSFPLHFENIELPLIVGSNLDKIGNPYSALNYVIFVGCTDL